MMYLGRRNQGCITLLASVIPPYKTHMIVLVDDSPLTDDDACCNGWMTLFDGFLSCLHHWSIVSDDYTQFQGFNFLIEAY
jgi:hypothetical protein